MLTGSCATEGRKRLGWLGGAERGREM